MRTYINTYRELQEIHIIYKKTKRKFSNFSIDSKLYKFKKEIFNSYILYKNF